MARRHRDQSEGKRAKRPRKAKRPLSAHPALPAVLGLWGACLGAAVVLILPVAVVSTVAGEGDGARLLAAMVAALLLGGLVGLAGLVLTRRARQHMPIAGRTLAEQTIQRYRTINPARDLGADSFDAPLDLTAFGTDDAAAGEQPNEADLSPPAGTGRVAGPYSRWRQGLAPTSANSADQEQEPGSNAPPAGHEEPLDEPMALDLAEFASIPGRNAVWVDGGPEREPEAPIFSQLRPQSPPQSEPRPQPAPRPRPTSRETADVVAARVEPAAVARLRSVPPGDLNMVQMVERFAIALQERRAMDSLSPRSGSAERETELAVALRELAQLTGEGGQQQPIDDDDLHAALRRLQRRRGAA